MNQNNYRQLFPNLYHFLGGYFHQDWAEDYDWTNTQRSFRPIVLEWKARAKQHHIDQLIAELTRFLALPILDAELDRVLERRFNVAYLPRDMSYRQWLEAILQILSDPTPPNKEP